MLKPVAAYVLLALVAASFAAAQTNESGVFIDPNPGTREWRADLNMSGNQVESIITNYGLIGKGNGSINQAGVWPKGTAHGHLHMMTGLVGARVPNINGVETVVVSDGYLEGGADALSETDGIVEWKFQPKPGYFNRNIEFPRIAHSLDSLTWPADWPDKPAEWNGKWNGFFGLNQFNADQEAFYVMDDWSNREFNVYPFGQDQPDKRGLGLQVNVRLFQWAQALAKDILFMQYEVSNVGNITYTSRLDQNPIFFGGYTDTNPSGSGASDDAAAFNRQRDLVYGWSFTGRGTWQTFRDVPPGYVGWKFLESPSISNDGIDNDEDGLIDESRDNDAGSFIMGPCGNYGPPAMHWSGDEDCDWNPALDDKGTDGIGPDEEGYPGPDSDGTEGNGRPDQGEPNFGRLDKDESDQVGLTSFFAPLFGTVDVRDEESVWARLRPGFFDVPQQSVNQIWIFGSGPFSLEPGRTERFSTAFLWGANEDALFRTSQVAQRIYDADYRFARPPRQPQLQAIAGDRQVTLIWDDLAEQSRDPIYGRDFEGYRIIKSTDPQFRDAKDVTDALGNAVFKRGIAQFDKVNGLTGPHPLQFGEEIGLPNGVHFYMGDDTGLQHSYIDTDVVNGRTYFYAVLAYDAGYDNDFFDRGIADIENLFPISPAESPASITVQNGVIVSYDRNTASATPNPPPVDVEPGRLVLEGGRLTRATGVATGTVTAQAISEDILRDATYDVTFGTTRAGSSVEYETQTVTVTRNDGEVVADAVPVPATAAGARRRAFTIELLGEGILLQFDNAFPTLTDTQLRSGWAEGSKTNVAVEVSTPASFAFPDGVLWPVNAVVEIVGGETPADTAFFSSTGRVLTPVYYKVYEAETEQPLDFLFTEPRSTRDGRLDTAEVVQLMFKDQPEDSRFAGSWALSLRTPTDAQGMLLPPEQVVLPQPGDRFLLRARVPFGTRDVFTFGSTAARVVDNLSESLLDRITVVPNPYVVAHEAERATALTGQRERKIFFRHLPLQATVRIYTASGVYVREIFSDNGVAEWDLTTRDGLEAAYGLYFYHVRAEGIGEKVGKFAIIN